MVLLLKSAMKLKFTPFHSALDNYTFAFLPNQNFFFFGMDSSQGFDHISFHTRNWNLTSNNYDT